MTRRLTAIARRLIQDGFQLRAPVAGGSMLPWIRAGDCLVVAPLPMKNPLPGELVLFERDGALVAHRVVRRSRIHGNDCVVTRGDWMTVEDAPIMPEAVIGKVVAIDRRGRMIQLDRGFTSLLMRLTGWMVRRHPRVVTAFHRWRLSKPARRNSEASAPSWGPR
jgi:signal peptidase I